MNQSIDGGRLVAAVANGCRWRRAAWLVANFGRISVEYRTNFALNDGMEAYGGADSVATPSPFLEEEEEARRMKEGRPRGEAIKSGRMEESE